MKRRDLIKALEQAGYTVLRDTGNHTVYHKPGQRRIEIPRHKEVNELTARQILRDAGLK